MLNHRDLTDNGWNVELLEFFPQIREISDVLNISIAPYEA